MARRLFGTVLVVEAIVLLAEAADPKVPLMPPLQLPPDVAFDYGGEATTYEHQQKPPPLIELEDLTSSVVALETTTQLKVTTSTSNDEVVDYESVSYTSYSRQLLLQHLMQPIHKQQNSDSLPTHVKVKLIPIKIQDLNEKNEVLETTLRLQVTWKDSRLAWSPELFNNATEMIIPGSAIWSPDIAILNSVSDIYHVVRDTRFEMKVEYNGRIWWHPTGIVKTYCKLRLRYFPFDRQMCKIVLESPTLDIRLMNLTLRSLLEPVETVMYIDGETWDLLGVYGYNILNKVTSKTYFARVEFGFHIQRARIYHLLNVIFPAIFLSLVQVMFFLLPATHPQRVGSSTTTLLSVVVFQSVAVSQLPKTSSEVPILAIYIFMVTLVSGLSVCTSIFMSRFALYADRNTKLPPWLESIPHPRAIIHRAINLARKNSKTRHDIDEERQIGDESPPSTSSRHNNNQNDDDDDLDMPLFNTWSEVSSVFDTFLMLIAVSIAVLSPIILFVIIPWLVYQV